MLLSDNCKTAFDIWLAARGGNDIPAKRHFGVERLKPVLASTAVFRTVIDGHRRITFYGSALREALGFNPTGMDVADVYAPNDPHTLRAFHAFLFDTGYIAVSLRALRPNTGHSVTVEQLLLPVGNAKGRPELYVAVAGNVPGPEDDTLGDNETLDVTMPIERTIYDPRTLMPVDCEATTDRDDPKHMKTPIIERDTAA